jgi:hypothetical protein
MSDSFTLDVKNWADSFNTGAEQAIRGATIKLWSSIIKATPVDSGRARSNWFATGQKPSVKVTSSGKDVTGESAITNATSVVLSLQDWSVFTLTNNLAYIPSLEYGLYSEGPKTVGGYSRQAPAGMVRINIARFNKLLEAEAKRTLPK